ncbi:hypothetical protein BDV93DRAFT_565001 [Ceratobasidium sp. AG-I]|nr:hypothetical protein BDV93DRAFT_565001 [Ceratobasidium sp. AG-I]
MSQIVHNISTFMRNKHEHLCERYPTLYPVGCRHGHVLVRLRSKHSSRNSDRPHKTCSRPAINQLPLYNVHLRSKKRHASTTALASLASSACSRSSHICAPTPRQHLSGLAPSASSLRRYPGTNEGDESDKGWEREKVEKATTSTFWVRATAFPMDGGLWGCATSRPFIPDLDSLLLQALKPPCS